MIANLQQFAIVLLKDQPFRCEPYMLVGAAEPAEHCVLRLEFGFVPAVGEQARLPFQIPQCATDGKFDCDAAF